MADALPITERLPPELLGLTLTYASIPDVLRLKQVWDSLILSKTISSIEDIVWQVNRRLRDFINNSPNIEYRIDLFAAGLMDNPASNLTLAAKREAFNAHCTKWEIFRPAKKWQRTNGSTLDEHQVRAHGADSSKFLQSFTLGSISQAIPRNGWKIPLPDYPLVSFAFNPYADVLVVAVEREPR